jgi:hypothetical protein
LGAPLRQTNAKQKNGRQKNGVESACGLHFLARHFSADAVFIFLPGIFLLACFCSPL